MLLKKIFVMKGDDVVKSVLKITLLEKGYTEIELNTHYAYGENYTFILKSGTFLHVQTYDGKKLKRKLPPIDIDDVQAGVCYNGKILSWSAQTPIAPYCLSELAEKYSVIKIEKKSEPVSPSENTETPTGEQSSDDKNIADVNEKENEPVDDNASDNSSEIELEEKQDELSVFDVVGLENKSFENVDGSFIRETDPLGKEIEDKYSTYPHNEKLEKLFPESKWINEDNDESSVGLLYNSSGITHICYAKKGNIDEPFDESASYYDGYWIVFNEC